MIDVRHYKINNFFVSPNKSFLKKGILLLFSCRNINKFWEYLNWKVDQIKFMDDNANLEKITRTKLLMTEGESRRGRGGRENIWCQRHTVEVRHPFGFPARTSLIAHASLHKPTVNLCFKAGDLLLQLFLFSRRLEENMSKQLFWN